MSVVTKRKWVRQEVLQDFSLPKSNQTIVRIMRNAGNNLHEVETALGETFLASLPVKFRKTCYIKRGDFVMTEPIEEGNKVKGEVVRILYAEHITEIYKHDMWPETFAGLILKKYGIGKTKTDNYFGLEYKQKEDETNNEESKSDNDDDDIPANPNQPLVNYGDYESSEEESDDDEIPENPNRPPPVECVSDSSSSESEEEN